MYVYIVDMHNVTCKIKWRTLCCIVKKWLELFVRNVDENCLFKSVAYVVLNSLVLFDGDPIACGGRISGT